MACDCSEKSSREVYISASRVSFAQVLGEVRTHVKCAENEQLEITPPAGFLLPAVPAHNLEQISFEEEASELPTKPILKCTWNSRFIGWRSGKRSAIIAGSNAKLYRLKGCGNEDYGFPVESGEVRGCMFQQSCLRELYMSSEVAKCLKKHTPPLECGNVPIGYYKYDSDSWGDPNPQVDKYCGIFETFGDRRAAQDVLSGLHKLAEMMTPSTKELSLRVMKIFPQSRCEDGVPGNTFFSCAVCEEPPINIVEMETETRLPAQPMNLSNNLKPLWDRNIRTVGTYQEENGSKLNLIAYLFWRTGYECGRVQRIFHKEKISWGTYRDELALHCNAHPNNMCLLPPTVFSASFFAPLDFDMAYYYSSYKGNFDIEGTENIEVNSMRMCLAGGDVSTGVEGHLGECNTSTGLYATALRDTALAGFNAGYGGVEDTYFKASLVPACYALIELGIIANDAKSLVMPTAAREV